MGVAVDVCVEVGVDIAETEILSGYVLPMLFVSLVSAMASEASTKTVM